MLLAALAYTLMINLRRLALRGTELAQACTAAIRTKLLKIGAAVVRRPAAGLVHTTGPSRLNLGPASNREGTGAAGGQHGEEHPLRHIAMALRLPQHQCQAPNGEQPGRDCRKHRQNPPIRGR